MRLRFVASELRGGMRRNLAMSLAVVVTTAVSLALLGAGLLIRSQVDTMKDYWYDKVEVAVFLCAAASTSPSCADGAVSTTQRATVKAKLEALPQVDRVYYESQTQAFARFKQQFKDSPDLVRNLTPDALPESFRVKLKNPKDYAVVASAVEGQAGVESVTDQRQLLERFFRVLNGFQLAALVCAAIQLVAAMLLIGNTIRVAAMNRRRETSIMRLVGASRTYILLPFLLEGVLAGLIGAAVAAGLLVAFKSLFVDDQLRPVFQFTPFIGSAQVWAVVPVLVVVGVVFTGLASFLSLRRAVKV